jgi:hypothetical protein
LHFVEYSENYSNSKERKIDFLSSMTTGSKNLTRDNPVWALDFSNLRNANPWIAAKLDLRKVGKKRFFSYTEHIYCSKFKKIVISPVKKKKFRGTKYVELYADFRIH